MGFWTGVAKGVESIEAQRNLENERSDRKDATAKADARYEAALTIDAEKWKNTLAQQDYRVKQDALSITREDARYNSDRLTKLALEGIPVAGSGGTRSSGSSNTSGTTTAGTTKQDLTHTLQQLVSYGAKDSNLLNLAGGGNQVAADALKAYESLSELAGKDKQKIDVNEFLETAVMVTTPGEKFDLEKVAASLGISMDEVKSQAGLEAILVKRFTEKDMNTTRFTYNYEAPMELEDYNRYTDTIKANMVDDINNEIATLRSVSDDPDKANSTRLNRLNTAVNSLEGDNPSYSLAFEVLGDEAILPFVGNEQFMNANFGGEIQRAKERYLANQDSSTLPDEGIQDGGIANVLAQYGMTDADIPRFTQEEYNSAEEDPGTPYIYLDGVLRANKAILSRGPEGQVDPTTPPMPSDNNTDPAMGQTESAFSSRQPGDDPSPRGITTGPEPKSYKGEAGSTYTSFFTGRPTMSDGPSPQMTPEETATYNDMTIPQDAPERGSIFPTREERAASNAASPNEYETPAPMQRATDERGARNDARAARNASKIEQEDGQLLLDYLQDDSTPPEMIDAMSDEFEKTYGFQALRDLLATLN
jgi:hypothetical protein